MVNNTIITQDYMKPFLAEGKLDEQSGMSVISKKYGGLLLPASKELDMKCHVDFIWITKKGNICTIDKKAPKKLRREDSECSNEYTWVEIKNVLGNEGWMYNQTAKIKKLIPKLELIPELDFVLFESLDDLICISRIKLTEMVLEKTKDKPTLQYKTYKPYDLYTRSKYQRENGEYNKDVMTLVPFNDLREISEFIIKK